MTHLSVPVAEASARPVLRPGELAVEPGWLEDGVCVVFVAGEVDMQTAASLEDTLDQVSETNVAVVIVDLRECSFIDSSGLDVLVASQKRLRDAGTVVSLVASRRVLRVLQLTGLDAVFTIYGSPAAALAPARESWEVEARRRVSIRAANERLEQACVGLGAMGEGRFVFFCECGDRACTALLHVDLVEYESVRAKPARFLIAPNHENPEAERVVEENGRFAMVETVTGLLSKPALESNPRWQRGEPW